MKIRPLLLAGVSLLAFELVSKAEIKVVAEHEMNGTAFKFRSVPPPANNDGASSAVFTLVDGERDSNGGDLAVLHDGRVPTEEDQSSENFFFRAGTDGGRIELDLGKVISVKQVASEIDVIDADGPPPTSATPGDGKPILKSFETEGGKYQFTIDATVAPDLMEWAEKELRPVVQEWYPKLVAMLPSDGFKPATNITLRFRNDMGGTPASAGGGRVNLNTGWFRRELKREARGSVVHELTHVVQDYGRARRTNPDATRTPGWLVEGIPDYIRWFLYEPETKGAEITERNLARAKYDASYRITGNFLNSVTQKYDKEIVRKLNAMAREGKYTEQLWKDWTGKTVQELGDEWKKENEARLKRE